MTPRPDRGAAQLMRVFLSGMVTRVRGGRGAGCLDRQGAPAMRGGSRGARSARRGRLHRHFAEAEADFSSGALAGDPSTKVWQGYIAASRTTGPMRLLQQGQASSTPSPRKLARPLRRRPRHGGGRDGMRSLRALLASYASSQPNVSAPDQLTARLVRRRGCSDGSEPDRALAVYTKTVARWTSPRPRVCARSSNSDSGGAESRRSRHAQLSAPEMALARDATELAVIRTLGELYLQGRCRP